MYKRTLIILLSVFLLLSCRREPGFPSYDTDLLFPLLRSEIDISNILPDSVLGTNPDNSLVLNYNTNFYSLTVDSLFEIPDTTINYGYIVPFGSIIVSPGQDLLNVTDQNQYQINGVELTRVIVKTGYIKAEINNTVNKRMRVVFTIPDAIKNSQPFSKTVIVPAAIGANPGILSDTFHLDGYDIDLRGPNNNSYNTIVFNTLGEVDPTEIGTDEVFAGEGIVMDLSFLDVVPYYARGYFGTGLYPIGPDSSSFDLFKKITSGVLLLEDATAILKLTNYVGVDSRTKIMELTSVNTNSGNAVSLNHPIINTNINLNRAVDYSGTVAPSIYSVTLNTANSNFKAMLENLPDKFRYQLETEINPMGNVSGGGDFVYYGKGLHANLDLNIPLSLAAGNLTMVDTVPFSALDPETNHINYGNLILYAENGFPFDCTIKFRMLDANMDVIGELMPAISTIDEAPLGTNNIVTQPRMTKLIIPLTSNTISQLERTKNLRLSVVFNTGNYPDYIKIYSTYKIAVQIVGDINYTVTGN